MGVLDAGDEVGDFAAAEVVVGGEVVADAAVDPGGITLAVEIDSATGGFDGL